MRYGKVILVALGCAALSACAPDHVMFVTDTSLGINVETKPTPKASVAFDRTEGYIGPHYANGALPPVVGSVHVEGESLLSPTVTQLYATGPAAIVVSGGTATEPAQLKGDKQWAFFGTATSVGFKLAFDTTANVPIPDSFLFGYRRREFSYIPVGTDPDTHTDTYASALASVNSGTNAGSNASGSTFHHSQFIATGGAAVALAGDTEIQRDFKAAAVANAIASLSPSAKQAAIDLGNKDYDTQVSNLGIVMNAIQTSGQLDPARLKGLIDKANTAKPDAIEPGTAATLQGAPDAPSVRALLETNQAVTNALAAAAAN